MLLQRLMHKNIQCCIIYKSKIFQIDTITYNEGIFKDLCYVHIIDSNAEIKLVFLEER